MTLDKHDVIRLKKIRQLAAQETRKEEQQSLIKADTDSRTERLGRIVDLYGPSGVGIRSVKLTKHRKREWNPEDSPAPKYAFPVWIYFWLVFGMWWIFPSAAIPFLMKVVLSGLSGVTSLLSVPMSWRTVKLLKKFGRPTKKKYQLRLDSLTEFLDAVPDDVTIEELEDVLNVEVSRFEMHLIKKLPASALSAVYNPHELVQALEQEADAAREANALGMDVDEYSETKRSIKHWAVGATSSLFRGRKP